MTGQRTGDVTVQITNDGWKATGIRLPDSNTVGDVRMGSCWQGNAAVTD